jgi:hypothetical protein
MVIPRRGRFVARIANAEGFEDVQIAQLDNSVDSTSAHEPSRFGTLESMRSVCIPVSIEILCKNCFIVRDRSRVGQLEHVTFEAGSKLCEIASGEFFDLHPGFSGETEFKGWPSRLSTATSKQSGFHH